MFSLGLLAPLRIVSKSRPTELSLRLPRSRALFTSNFNHTNAAKLRSGEDFFEKNQRLKRPMSPHLTIYKPQLTSMLSITHRGTGFFMSSILSGFSITMLFLPSSYPYYLEMIQSMNFGSFLIFTAKLALAFPVMFHICNGIRHLAWDVGQGFKLKTLYQSGYAVVGVAAVLSVILAFM